MPPEIEAQPKAAAAPQRSTRYLFVAKFKATDVISGKQIEGLTTDLSEGGCCVLARRAPYSPGTQIRVEISKNNLTLHADATVIYNLKDQIMGLQFGSMNAEGEAILRNWIKAATPSLAAS